ncbi:MAG: hypothetical protein IJF88_06045 [Oscillospiraceae bacterium]|nr:hypothetical protein [Oscillospiraceae bacterium]
MREPNAASRARLAGWGLVALALTAFALLNAQTSLMRDDYAYAVNFLTKAPIRSFGDIFESLGIHYQRVNGRLPVHFLAHLFLWLGKEAFHILNPLAFGGLVTLICYHACGSLRQIRPGLWLSAFGGLWLLTPAFGESFLWLTGAANYLYGVGLILLYLIPFRRLEEGRALPRHPVPAALAALAGGVLAGWTNENTACALIGLIALLIVRRALTKQPLPLWVWTGLLGCVIGLGLMLLAPGELNRLDSAGGFGGPGGLLRRALGLTWRLLRAFWPGLLAWLALLLAFLRRPERDLGRLAMPLGWLLAGLAAAYAMAFSPEIPDRVLSGPLVFFLISALSLWRALDWKADARPALWQTLDRKPGARPALGLALGLLCAGSLLFSLARTLPKLQATAGAFAAREREAAAQLAQGETQLALPAVHGSGSRFDPAEPEGDLSPDPAHWSNVALARYLGATEVTLREASGMIVAGDGE